MKIKHPTQHIDLEGLNQSYEALDRFLQDDSKKKTTSIIDEDRYQMISLKDQLQDMIIKFRMQNTHRLSKLNHSI